MDPVRTYSAPVTTFVLSAWSTFKMQISILHTPWSRVLLGKLTGFQLVKKFLAFMEPESPSPYPQVPATCPYAEPARSNPYLHLPLPEDPS
jgi:hypothetical protein